MTKKKIVLFLPVPYDSFFQKKHLIKDAKKYFDVKFLSLENLYFKSQNHNSGNLEYINYLKKLRKRLLILKPEYGVMIYDDFFHQKLGKLCKEELNIKTVFLSINQCPESHTQNDLKLILNTFLTKYILYYLKKTIFRLVLLLLNLKTNFNKEEFKFDFAITGGDIGYKMFPINNSRKIIPSSSFDYQLSRNFRKKGKQKNISIFLDENLYDHRDFKIQNRKKKFVSKKYFKELNNFFSFYEKKFDAKVLICVHPRVKNIDNYKKKFFNRKCYIGKSHELVKSCKNVILHPSTTSLNLPILYNKPLIFLTSNELLKQLEWGARIARRKSIFSNSFINISSFKAKNLSKNLFKIKKQEYKFYMNKFIRCSDANRNSNAWRDLKLQGKY